jgi:hypothetical protein
VITIRTVLLMRIDELRTVISDHLQNRDRGVELLVN